MDWVCLEQVPSESNSWGPRKERTPRERTSEGRSNKSGFSFGGVDRGKWCFGDSTAAFPLVLLLLLFRCREGETLASFLCFPTLATVIHPPSPPLFTWLDWMDGFMFCRFWKLWASSGGLEHRKIWLAGNVPTHVSALWESKTSPHQWTACIIVNEYMMH